MMRTKMKRIMNLLGKRRRLSVLATMMKRITDLQKRRKRSVPAMMMRMRMNPLVPRRKWLWWNAGTATLRSPRNPKGVLSANLDRTLPTHMTMMNLISPDLMRQGLMKTRYMTICSCPTRERRKKRNPVPSVELGWHTKNALNPGSVPSARVSTDHNNIQNII